MSGVFNHATYDKNMEVNSVLGAVKRLQLKRDEDSLVEPIAKEQAEHFLATVWLGSRTTIPFG